MHVGGSGPRLTMPIVAGRADWWNCPSSAADRLAGLRPSAGAARISVQHPVGLAASSAVRDEVAETVRRRFVHPGRGGRHADRPHGHAGHRPARAGDLASPAVSPPARGTVSGAAEVVKAGRPVFAAGVRFTEVGGAPPAIACASFMVAPDSASRCPPLSTANPRRAGERGRTVGLMSR
jgi:hypothetical protein